MYLLNPQLAYESIMKIFPILNYAALLLSLIKSTHLARVCGKTQDSYNHGLCFHVIKYITL